MNRFLIVLAATALTVLSTAGLADEVVQQIQKNLVALGYDPGSIQGDLTVETAIAISQFQAANNVPVTGEPSPLLAGMIAAQVEQMRDGGAPSQAPTAPAQAARQPAQAAAAAASPAAEVECEPTVADVAENTGQKARRFGRLASAFGRLGGSDAAREAAQGAAAAAEVAAVTGELAGDRSGC